MVQRFYIGIPKQPKNVTGYQEKYGKFVQGFEFYSKNGSLLNTQFSYKIYMVERFPIGKYPIKIVIKTHFL